MVVVMANLVGERHAGAMVVIMANPVGERHAGTTLLVKADLVSRMPLPYDPGGGGFASFRNR